MHVGLMVHKPCKWYEYTHEWARRWTIPILGTKLLECLLQGEAKRLPLFQTPGGMQEVRIISEPDMLRLIVSSKLPAAERFERWVFEEVLPTLRKTGTYSTPGALPTLPGPTQDRIAALLLIGQYISTVPGITIGCKFGLVLKHSTYFEVFSMHIFSPFFVMKLLNLKRNRRSK